MIDRGSFPPCGPIDVALAGCAARSSRNHQRSEGANDGGPMHNLHLSERLILYAKLQFVNFGRKHSHGIPWIY